MAAVATTSADNSFMKKLVESSTLKSIPTELTFAAESDSLGSHSDSLPIVDFSLLNSSDRDQRSRALRDLAHACQEWGFFILLNHGVPEALLNGTIEASLEYFDLPEEDKRRYEPKSASDPIKSGSGSVINVADQKVHLWRDYVKAYVHPEFYCPEKPHGLRNVVREFSEKTLPVYRNVLRAIGQNLGFEEGFVDDNLKLDKCFQMYAANYYPPCPQPDQAIGIPAHTDHGLLTFLIHNGVAGLQIQHNGEWFNTNSPKNAILVNIGDHLEILSNGRYKSVRHRAVVNTEAMRISVVLAQGAAPDVVVAPAPQLVERDGRPLYKPMKFIEYVETMLSNRLMGKTNLDCIKIEDE